MIGELVPTEWYHPSAASRPVPRRWEGWVNFGGACGRVWPIVTLTSEE